MSKRTTTVDPNWAKITGDYLVLEADDKRVRILVDQSYKLEYIAVRCIEEIRRRRDLEIRWLSILKEEAEK